MGEFLYEKSRGDKVIDVETSGRNCISQTGTGVEGSIKGATERVSGDCGRAEGQRGYALGVLRSG